MQTYTCMGQVSQQMIQGETDRKQYLWQVFVRLVDNTGFRVDGLASTTLIAFMMGPDIFVLVAQGS